MTDIKLSRAPKVMLFYGLAGAGKSYVGNLINHNLQWPVYHADEDINDEMKQALIDNRPFTDAMRDRYMEFLIGKINALKSQSDHLVVTQGIYKQRHRDLISAKVDSIDLICVQANQSLLRHRLNQRPDGISPSSAAALLLDFEPPPPGAKIIDNDLGDESIIEQLNALYAEEIHSPSTRSA